MIDDQARKAQIAGRYRTEKRFRMMGAMALLMSAIFLMLLVLDIFIKALPAFHESSVQMSVLVDPAKVDSKNPKAGDFEGIIKDAMRSAFPEVTERADKKKLAKILSGGAADELRAMVMANPALIGSTVQTRALLSADADMYVKGYFGTASISKDANGAEVVKASVPETNRQVSDKEIIWIESLKARGLIDNSLAWRLFQSGDSREPELSGIKGAVIGSLITIFITLIISLPLGVAAAICLEEFAVKNRLTQFLEVNINNLAAVPSIIFGLLGLAVFLNLLGLPRSTPLVGGLVLALLVLPTIIIASRAAVRAVPPSIREAALGVGASHQQAVFHHVLPLALPGILTGTILGVARALGETAPLLMIGMVAFIADVPHGITDAATTLPVQIFLWSDLPELAFQSRTSAAIIILLVLLFTLNAVAIYLRKRFEQRW
jgi:phosphate transport system permease protein